MFFIWVNGIAVAAQRGHLNPAIRKFLQPGFGFGGVIKKLLHWAMFRAWVAACPDFHSFEAERAYFVEHFIERKFVVNGVEDADGNFALRQRRSRRLLTRSGSSVRVSARNGVPHIDSSRNSRSQQTSAGRSEKLPAVNRFTNTRAAHAEPPEVAVSLQPNYGPRHYTPLERRRKSQNRFSGDETGENCHGEGEPERRAFEQRTASRRTFGRARRVVPLRDFGVRVLERCRLGLFATQRIQSRDRNSRGGNAFRRHLSILNRVYEHFNRLAGVRRNEDSGREQSTAHPCLACFGQAIAARERQLQPPFALVFIRQFLECVSRTHGHGVILRGNE